MSTKNIVSGALAGLILVGGVAGMASSQSVAEATGLTEEQVIEIALLEVPGDVIDVEHERHRGQEFYEIEIAMEDGQVMELEVAADTGEILAVKADDGDNDREGKRGGGKNCDKDQDSEA